MSQIVSRLKEFTTSKNISTRQFESNIGISTGALSRAFLKGSDIQSKWIEKVCQVYDELNPEWLLTGNGTMLKEFGTTIPQEGQTSPVPSIYGVSPDELNKKEAEILRIVSKQSTLSVEEQRDLLIEAWLFQNNKITKYAELIARL